MSPYFWIIIGGAVATYLARAGGHLILSRFDHVPPRVEAGLNAVPAAVLTAILAPSMLAAGPVEFAALGSAAIAGYRGGGVMTIFLAGTIVLVAGRNLL